MKIKNNFKYLPLFFLIPTILVVFSISAKPDNPLIGSVITQLSDSNKGLIDQSTKDKLIEGIDELKQFYTTTKPELINELTNAINEQRATNPDIFNSTKETLESLKKSFADVENSNLESLKKTFPEVQQSNLDSIKASSNDIVKTLDNILGIITLHADEPITPRIPSRKLEEVQRKVGSTYVDYADGLLGNGTLNDISYFLDNQNNTLVVQLKKLEEEVNDLKLKPTTDEVISKLKYKIGQLEKDNIFLKKLIFVTSLLSIANLVALLRMIWVVDKRKKENNHQIENKHSNINGSMSLLLEQKN